MCNKQSNQLVNPLNSSQMIIVPQNTSRYMTESKPQQLTFHQKIVVQTIHLSVRDALSYLKATYHITRGQTWLGQQRTIVREISTSILFKRARDFPQYHLTRIMTLQYLQDESLKNLKEETNPLKRQHIIDSIAALQYHMAAFDEASKGIIEVNERNTTGLPIPESKVDKPIATPPIPS